MLRLFQDDVGRTFAANGGSYDKGYTETAQAKAALREGVASQCGSCDRASLHRNGLILVFFVVMSRIRDRESVLTCTGAGPWFSIRILLADTERWGLSTRCDRSF